MVTGSEATIFPDQRWFIDRLSAAGHFGVLAVPGTEISVDAGAVTVEHPVSEAEIDAIFTDKAAYLDEYAADWNDWLRNERDSWRRPRTDLVAALDDWWGRSCSPRRRCVRRSGRRASFGPMAWTSSSTSRTLG